jgi:hypothetical protein
VLVPGGERHHPADVVCWIADGSARVLLARHKEADLLAQVLSHSSLMAVTLLVCLVTADLIAAVQVVPHGSPLFVLATAAILPVVLLVVAWPVLGPVLLLVGADRVVQSVCTACEERTAERRTARRAVLEQLLDAIEATLARGRQRRPS